MVQLKAGEWYRRRDHRIVGPICELDGTVYPFGCDRWLYTSEGSWVINEESDQDLVEHIPRTDPRHPEYHAEQKKPDTVHVIVAIDDGGNEAMYVGGNLVEHEGNTVYATDIAKATNGMTIEFTQFDCGSFDGDWPLTFDTLLAMCGTKEEESKEPELKLCINTSGHLALYSLRHSDLDGDWRELTPAELLALKHLIILTPEAD